MARLEVGALLEDGLDDGDADEGTDEGPEIDDDRSRRGWR